MKRNTLLTLLFALFFVLGTPLYAKTAQFSSPLEYLNAMTKAHKTLNYEQLYILQQGEDVQSLRYRHAYWNEKEYAQLLRLDNNREEMILRDDMVSYFGEFQPFSLPSSHILDDLPSVLYTDFNQLQGYHFVDSGRMRVADRLARVIRIVPRDDFRYQYEVWIDEESHLLLRSDLLDRERNVLEQFKVIQNTVNEEFLYIVEPISTLILPALIQPKENSSQNTLNWRTSWVPQGFKAISSGRQTLSEFLMDNEQVESQLYSDGLFSFTIYVVQNKGIIFDEQFWRQGKMSIYSQTLGDKDVVIVGEIPLVSARHIVQEIKLQEIKPN
ncbi:MucB/RseB C-terminal domain-containing protein [Ursidibacter arcticus]